MEFWLGIIILILCVVIAALMLKIHFMRKAALEIKEAFADRLQSDTNMVITLSCKDKYMR